MSPTTFEALKTIGAVICFFILFSPPKFNLIVKLTTWARTESARQKAERLQDEYIADMRQRYFESKDLIAPFKLKKDL